ncbi:MAG: hypothetical protein SF052_10475 [Bacteroidia bacterium]|nr:hypothetical protein [Bacteroidia bacterium]
MRYCRVVSDYQYTLLRPHTPVVKIEENIPLPVAAIINCAVAAGALRVTGAVNGLEANPFRVGIEILHG